VDAPRNIAFSLCLCYNYIHDQVLGLDPTDFDNSTQPKEVTVRVFAFVIAALAALFIATPTASADTCYGPDGRAAICAPAPEGPPEMLPPELRGPIVGPHNPPNAPAPGTEWKDGQGHIPPPIEFAPTPDDPGTWSPDPDLCVQPYESDHSGPPLWLVSFISASIGIVVMQVLSALRCKMSKPDEVLEPKSGKILHSSEHPFS
jgi:hypothetical protein